MTTGGTHGGVEDMPRFFHRIILEQIPTLEPAQTMPLEALAAAFYELPTDPHDADDDVRPLYWLTPVPIGRTFPAQETMAVIRSYGLPRGPATAAEAVEQIVAIESSAAIEAERP